jgi:hypothetical protein
MAHPFPPRCGSSSPWGPIQTVTPLGPDAVAVTTASHGALQVSPGALERMPAPIRQTAYSANGWFEEDCDWALPYLALGLDAFEPEPARGPALRAAAIRTVRAYHPDHVALLGLAAEAGEPAHG